MIDDQKYILTFTLIHQFLATREIPRNLKLKKLKIHGILKPRILVHFYSDEINFSIFLENHTMVLHHNHMRA